MNHKEYRQKLPLLVYGELSKEEQTDLNTHLDNCAECSDELQELQMLQSTADAAASKPSERLLEESRMELRAALRLERSRYTWKDIWTERLQGWLPIFRLSFATMASLAFGIFIGYKAIRPEQTEVTQQQKTDVPVVNATGNVPVWDSTDLRITNVKFEDADASDGNVEFTFEAVTPMTYKGSINDPKAQKVLTYALVNAQNPGIRLRAVNALSVEKLKQPDPTVKNALLEALLKDENPGVRMEALTALQRLEMDDDIKKAFLQVLVKDTNAGLRIAAIKSIEAERLMDHEVVKALKAVQSDDEEYVRLSAKKMIQEVSEKQ